MISTELRHAPPLMIVGASTRAAAFSALRAGFEPLCLDQFADMDLQTVVDAIRIEDYPARLAAEAALHPDIPVMYVGAMENHLAVVDELAAQRPLYGNPSPIVQCVRDPANVAEALRATRLPALDVRTAADPPPADGDWMLKPLLGSAGRGICIWENGAPHGSTLAEPHYFQRRAHGVPYSAVFVAPPDRSDVRFVGITRQLVGLPELRADSFSWCGSIGPVALPVEVEHAVRRIGNLLSWKLNLCGLFGCDFILDKEGVPWLTEVNPRYPASSELLEFSCGLSLIRDHVQAFGVEPPELPREPAVHGGTIGKFVLYADRDLQAPDLTAQMTHDPWQIPIIADVPIPDSTIPAGTPFCTLYTTGTTADACLAALPARLEALTGSH